MKTIAFSLSLECLPFELDLKNIADTIDERMRAMGSEGYLGKVMAVGEGLPIAVLLAYEEKAEPDADKAIAAFMSIIGQAVVAFGGWSLWDAIRNECGAWEFSEQEMPDFYAQLVGNLKVEDK
ncbi:hypothetical protein [Limnohabitans sp. 15K]|uniref:hypothetical protein n=1 Tax=Limnohabitans sp. 15K TaxID=1100706 RepID=UPI000C1EEFA2|nr:hypothetical protein [Limnohabitans sp. 15K]PIT81902.1 hypothetical protein B9Z40_09945 [Limnohabitans sp. 15K]